MGAVYMVPATLAATHPVHRVVPCVVSFPLGRRGVPDQSCT